MVAKWFTIVYATLYYDHIMPWHGLVANQRPATKWWSITDLSGPVSWVRHKPYLSIATTLFEWNVTQVGHSNWVWGMSWASTSLVAATMHTLLSYTEFMLFMKWCFLWLHGYWDLYCLRSRELVCDTDMINKLISQMNTCKERGWDILSLWNNLKHSKCYKLPWIKITDSSYPCKISVAN